MQPSDPSELLGIPGQTTTLLPDGSSLLTGGMGDAGPVADAFLKPATGGQAVRLGASLSFARAWHTATLLPDGTVLVLGGIDATGNIAESAELFNPAIKTFALAAAPGLTPRAYHTATVLTDGTVLLAGGVVGDGVVSQTAEIWNPQTQTDLPLAAELNTARRNHTATLLPDGTVLLWGGTDANGHTLNNGDIYDPESQSFSEVATIPAEAQPSAEAPSVEASSPENGAQNVPLQGLISLRFSERLGLTTVNSTTVTLDGSQGTQTSVPITVVPAEAGMLAFVTYKGPLLPATMYTLSLDGLSDTAGRSLPQTQITFTTAASTATGDDEAWIPNGSGWRTGRADSPWQHQPSLQAPPGTTAIAGTVLKLNGLPLPNVTLQVGAFSALSDSTGRFLLALGSGTSGQQVLVMNGATANKPGKVYGLFQYAMNVKPGITNVIPFTIWMPLIDTAHAVTVPSPTKQDMVISSPLLPGLELLLPAGTVIWNYQNQIARTISITPIPLDRTPFPIPAQFTMYFTIQPGGAWLQLLNPNGPKGLLRNNVYNFRGESHAAWRGWNV